MNDIQIKIDELKDKIQFYEEQLAEDEDDLYEEYEVELVAAIDELQKLEKMKEEME